MAYNAAKDEVVWEGGFDDIGVSVHRYNGGALKVQLSRKYKKDDGSTSFGKTGRLTISEFEGICAMRNEVYSAGVEEDAR